MATQAQPPTSYTHSVQSADCRQIVSYGYGMWCDMIRFLFSNFILSSSSATVAFHSFIGIDCCNLRNLKWTHCHWVNMDQLAVGSNLVKNKLLHHNVLRLHSRSIRLTNFGVWFDKLSIFGSGRVLRAGVRWGKNRNHWGNRHLYHKNFLHSIFFYQNRFRNG